MKRAIVSMMVLALMAGALGVEASAKGKKGAERTATAEYSAPGYIYTDYRVSVVCADGSGCFSFDAQPGEKYVRIVATDETGTPVPMDVRIGDELQQFCGETDAPLALGGAEEVTVWVGVKISTDCSGVATQGSVDVTFLRSAKGHNHQRKHHH